MIESLLGLMPKAFENRLEIVRPVLPAFARQLELHGLRVGKSSVDLRFKRTPDGLVDTHITQVRGKLDVEVRPGGKKTPERESTTSAYKTLKGAVVKNEVVVVTGASAGLGRAIVRHFGKNGARVGLLARGVEGLEGAKREIEAAGGKALVLPTDVADSNAMEKAAAAVERSLARLISG